jgi:hypothetical protein
MKISHIVTNGCSFTFCQNLPIAKGWPALVANNLDCPLVNLGLPGVGNDSINRRTHEYLYHDTESKPLVIIGWSQPWRREAWFHLKDRPYYGTPEYYTVPHPRDSITNAYDDWMLEHWSDEDFHRKTTLAKINLMNLFESLDIPYLMTDFMVQRDDEKICQMVDKKFPKLAEKILSNKYYINPAREFSMHYPNLPCGHQGEEAQVAVSDFITSKIKELYPDLSFTKTEPYYSLADYSTTNLYHQKYPQWCKFKLNSDTIV